MAYENESLIPGTVTLLSDLSRGSPLALLIVPLALSGLIAFIQPIQSRWNTAGICVAAAVFLTVYRLNQADEVDFQAMLGSALLAALPILGLFLAARRRDVQRRGWLLLILGPLAYWLGCVLVIVVWFFILRFPK
jgi:hypothetical protein